MRRSPRLIVASILAACSLGIPAVAQGRRHGASPRAGGFRLGATHYTVDQAAGRAIITVARRDARAPAHVAYIAVGLGHPCGAASCTATPPDNRAGPADFHATKGWLYFPRGVHRRTFSVAIVDHHFATLTKTVSIGLFASWPQRLASPSHAVLTIRGALPAKPRNPANPLELQVRPAPGDPLRGARFFVDRSDAPNHFAGLYPALRTIGDQPGVARFGAFSGNDVGMAVNRYLARVSAQEPRTVPMLATYELVNGRCGGYTPTPGEVAGYRGWISRFASGIGSHRAVLFLELDALIESGCLTQHGLAIRERELRTAISILGAQCPHLVIYLDAGAGDAVGAGRMAAMLRGSGIAHIQGFLLNATHFDWTSREIAYGEQISRWTGGKHFVINTGTNGRGPLVPPDPVRQGNEVLCNPSGRGLGPKPTTNTGYVNVDAFEWTTNPGESGGACVPGAPPTGYYWPQYGVMLVHNAVFGVDHWHAVRRWAVDARARGR